ncbi:MULTISPECIES: SRPBCC domain-containing protein [unclassified Brachybacterium]|uniref:SRPBCC family protein n=1 Tax=unclassified Brachybacterium TaxID=2623841 RepID=UPI00360C39A8
MSKEFEVRKEVVLEATPEQVWRAIATPEGQAAWSPDPYVSQDGTDVEIQEPERFALRTPEAENGAFHAFEYIVEARDGSTTTLRFVHSGYLGDDWDAEFDYGEMTAQGWDMYFHTLAEYLKHFADRPATFVVAEGPASSSSPEAWTQLERALGVDGPVEVGQQLTLTPEGLPRLEGEVDYARPGEDFIGLRAADGLYRFHGRAAMGLPVAVGHYLYTEDVDREAAQQAWKGWLERAYA